MQISPLISTLRFFPTTLPDSGWNFAEEEPSLHATTRNLNCGSRKVKAHGSLGVVGEYRRMTTGLDLTTEASLAENALLDEPQRAMKKNYGAPNRAL